MLEKFKLLDKICQFIVYRAKKRTVMDYRKKYGNYIHPTVKLGEVTLNGNIMMGEGSYIGSGQIFGGDKSRVKIGKYCAIGYNVHIKARTHSLSKPTPSEEEPNIRIEKNITIGDHVWIGDNVFIREGVEIGDNVVIGSNSVVTKNIPRDAVAGGVPAKILYYRKIDP